MDLQTGVRYERSEEHDPDWMSNALAAHIQHHLAGAVTINIQRTDGSRIVGPLLEVDGDVIALDRGDLSGTRVHVQTVAAFTLVPERIDQSDELRG